MPARVSESLILRTYPFREADLIVSFLARDVGKMRGVARRARRPKNSFGSGLERLSHVNVRYYIRENAELGSLDSCELIHSQFDLASDYEAGVALDFLAEATDQLLPASEPSEKFFRLLLAVLEYLRLKRGEGVWPAVTYFSLWAVKLSGILPDVRVSPESREIAEEMLRSHVTLLPERVWTRETAADLRRTLIHSMEDHIERSLVTARLLETL
jgi:DNA repair protein RecO (recombination protein O)